jgi:hypothetical protein
MEEWNFFQGTGDSVTFPKTWLGMISKHAAPDFCHKRRNKPKGVGGLKAEDLKLT